jgi:hypothetical protein
VVTVADLPDWVLDLVAAVEHFEYVHPTVSIADDCLARPLEAVPDEVRQMAKGWARARLRAEQGEGGTR